MLLSCSSLLECSHDIRARNDGTLQGNCTGEMPDVEYQSPINYLDCRRGHFTLSKQPSEITQVPTRVATLIYVHGR